MLRALLFAGAASIVAAGSAVAQTPFDVGVTAGIALSKFTGDGFNGGIERRMAPYAGVTALYLIDSHFAIESGIHYVSKGVAQEGGVGEITAKYLEIPLMARVAIELPGTAIQPVIMAGIAVAYNIGCEFEDSDESLNCEDDDAPFPLQAIDLGLTGGLGADYPLGPVIITPYVRYTAGLTDIPDVEGEDIEIRNNTIQFGITGRIPIL